MKQRITSVEEEIAKAKGKLARANENVARQRKVLDAVAQADADASADVSGGKDEDKGEEKARANAEKSERKDQQRGGQGQQKVSEAVRQMEAQRLRDAQAEARSYEITVRQFEGLLVGE